VIAGERAAALLWQGVVPLVPFLLLLNIRLWRNICPLGRLSEGPTGVAGAIDRPGIDRAAIGGAILLFAAILPFRSAWFATSGLVTAVFLGGAAAGALLLGRRRARRAGFCTTLCPMLPVELLYGQASLIEMDRGSCSTCTLCTTRACPQLSPRAAIAQHLGRARHEGGWTRTPFGAFAAAFPGVIAAFFLGDGSTPLGAAGQLLLGACLSWATVSLAVAVLRPRWDRALLGLGWLSVALWAWLALPGVAEVWGWPQGTSLLRASGETLALVWFVHGMRPGNGGRADGGDGVEREPRAA